MNSLFPRPILDGGLCALWLWWYLLPLFVCQCRLLFAVTSVVFALFAGLLAARRDYAWNSMHFFAVSIPPRQSWSEGNWGKFCGKSIFFLCQGSEPQADEINMVRLCLQSLQTTTTRKADQFWLVGAQFGQFVKGTPYYSPHKLGSLIKKL